MMGHISFFGNGMFFIIVPLILVFSAIFMSGSLGKIIKRLANKNGRYVRGKTTTPELKGQENHQTQIFRLAQSMGGRLSLSEVIIETGLGVREAEQILDNLVDGIHVSLEIDDSGRVYYVFSELIR